MRSTAFVKKQMETEASTQDSIQYNELWAAGSPLAHVAGALPKFICDLLILAALVQHSFIHLDRERCTLISSGARTRSQSDRESPTVPHSATMISASQPGRARSEADTTFTHSTTALLSTCIFLSLVVDHRVRRLVEAQEIHEENKLQPHESREPGSMCHAKFTQTITAAVRPCTRPVRLASSTSCPLRPGFTSAASATTVPRSAKSTCRDD